MKDWESNYVFWWNYVNFLFIFLIYQNFSLQIVILIIDVSLEYLLLDECKYYMFEDSVF